MKDKNVIVTGSTGALGKVTVKRLLENGAKVVALYRNEAKFRELQKFLGKRGENLTGFKGNATTEQSMKDLAEKTVNEIGQIDVLLNLIGGYRGGKELHETDEPLWNFMIDVNLKTAFLSTKAVLPYMIERNYGRIISVSARTALQEGRRKKSGAYAISKAGVKILTEVLAEETKKHDIRVNCIVPSTIDTPANRKMFPKADFSKWVAPEEIADVIIFLASDASNPISGASIPVYGKA